MRSACALRVARRKQTSGTPLCPVPRCWAPTTKVQDSSLERLQLESEQGSSAEGGRGCERQSILTWLGRESMLSVARSHGNRSIETLCSVPTWSSQRVVCLFQSRVSHGQESHRGPQNSGAVAAAGLSLVRKERLLEALGQPNAWEWINTE